jgi:hypothetical protein
MAGSIVISKTSTRDLRTIDFAWLVDELRKKSDGSAPILAKILWPHDEAGIDLIQADDLDSKEFKLFAKAVREVYGSLAAKGESSVGMVRFLSSLLKSIESDERFK